MSQRPSDEDRPRTPEQLPQEEFPTTPLSAVVERRADDSKRCILYPDEIEPAAAETHWLALDAEYVVDVSECR